MSFREKSAAAMATMMIAAAFGYLFSFRGAVGDGGTPWPFFALVPLVVAMIAASLVLQVILAIVYRSEARRPADEREGVILLRASRWSGLVLGVGAAAGAAAYLWYRNGDLLFHMVIGSLIAAQFAQYVFQLVLLRRSR